MNSNQLNFMKEALALAKNGLGTTSPNPMVGAVVVRSNEIIGRGFHQKAGKPHAEPNAVSDCGEDDISDCELYVTLEPCCHTNKRTPPCASLIIEKGIKKVYVATLDPNPEVSGKGVELLRSAGVEVFVGILEEQARQLNEVFNKAILSDLPFIHLKLAQTLDGKLATLGGDSKWITDESARICVHEMRLKYDAVMVGRSTLNNDNPSLDIRMGVDAKGKIPYRIIIGSPEKFTMNSKVLSDEFVEKTIVISTSENVHKNEATLLNRGVKVIKFNKNLRNSFKELKKLGIQSVLIEGGSVLAKEVLLQELYDRITLFIAPKIIGKGLSYFDLEKDKMKEAISFEDVEVSVLGDQAVFEIRR